MKKSFTFIELLIVIAIIAIIAAVAISNLITSRHAFTYEQIVKGRLTTSLQRSNLQSYLASNEAFVASMKSEYGPLPDGWLNGVIETTIAHKKEEPKNPLKEELKKLKEEVSRLKKKKLEIFRYEIKSVGSGFISEYALCKNNEEITRSKNKEMCDKLLKHLKEAQERGIAIGSSLKE